ncbi:hypothetical protein MAR_015302 [Mya arenaria]|uniref:Uncharacterized protein n=1 Tax=Mya arenaria TaxID=6604 RepID=A0ABY7FGN1_MYAAR|nr:hypothetical protein MAR_015302 [Mya arenaria]
MGGVLAKNNKVVKNQCAVMPRKKSRELARLSRKGDSQSREENKPVKGRSPSLELSHLPVDLCASNHGAYSTSPEKRAIPKPETDKYRRRHYIASPRLEVEERVEDDNNDMEQSGNVVQRSDLNTFLNSQKGFLNPSVASKTGSKGRNVKHKEDTSSGKGKGKSGAKVSFGGVELGQEANDAENESEVEMEMNLCDDKDAMLNAKGRKRKHNNVSKWRVKKSFNKKIRKESQYDTLLEETADGNDTADDDDDNYNGETAEYHFVENNGGQGLDQEVHKEVMKGLRMIQEEDIDLEVDPEVGKHIE